jgi:hypothetical protein
MKLSSIIASSWWVMILAVQGANNVQAMLRNGNHHRSPARRHLQTSRITSLTLINSISDNALFPLVNGTVVAMNTIAGMSAPSFNMNVTYTGKDIDSVKIGYNGIGNVFVSNGPWFSFCLVEGSRNFLKCDRLGLGTHTVTATAYSSKNAGGRIIGLPLTVTFTIVERLLVPTKAPVKAPTQVPVKAPTMIPVAMIPTKSPANAPSAVTGPSANLTTVLQGCYLRNLGTGVETQLTGSDSYPLNSANLAYSIRCDVIGNETDFIKFLYDGKEHDEFGEPRWLDGDTNAGEYIVPVPYLATCGTKSIFVQGNAWSRVLFEQNFTLVAICSGPLITPAPVTAPIPRAPTPPTHPSCSFPRVRRMAGCSV